jgi:O-antigen/teichoic acid export membrane protein
VRARAVGAGAPPSSRRGLLRRASWGITDQAFSSLTNFALTIVVARALSPTLFGAFSVAYLLYVFLLQLSRACSSEPLVVRYSAAPEGWRAGSKHATGVALGFGVVTALLTAGGALLLPDPTRSALLAMAVVLPGLLVQDVGRFVFFAEGRPARAAVNDMVWALVQFPALVIFLRYERATVAGLVLIWGISATIAALYGAAQARMIPSPFKARDWFREHRDLIPQFSFEFVMLRGAQQLSAYAVGVVAGLAALGSLRAAQVLFGPLNLFFLSARIVGVPEGVRQLADPRSSFRRAIRRLSIVLMTLAVVWGIPLLLLPDSVGRGLLHKNWHTAKPLLLPVLVATAAAGANVGSLTALRVWQAANESLRARLLISPVTVILGVTGAFWDGARGAAIGLAVAAWFGVLVYQRQVERVGADFRDEGSSTPVSAHESAVAR